MEKNFVSLIASNLQYQVFVIGEILKEAGIPYTIRDSSATTAILGSTGPLIYQEFMVSPERLQEAKDVLCANGVVCEVSERLLKRAMEEIVRPLLGGGARDLDRLIRFIEVNNKETARALLEATLEVSGGRQLIEELFFGLDREEDLACLRTLTRVLAPKMDGPFLTKVEEVMSSGQKDARLALLDVLPDLPDVPDRAGILAIALRDPSLEIREAAGEALFALGKGDYDYEAEGAPEEREEAVKRFLFVSR